MMEPKRLLGIIIQNKRCEKGQLLRWDIGFKTFLVFCMALEPVLNKKFL